jgi:hypothetical protein
MNAVQVSVVQIVGVALVLDRHVAAAGAVRVLMTRMLLTGHDLLLLAPRPLQGERHIARVHGALRGRGAWHGRVLVC